MKVYEVTIEAIDATKLGGYTAWGSVKLPHTSKEWYFNLECEGINGSNQLEEVTLEFMTTQSLTPVAVPYLSILFCDIMEASTACIMDYIKPVVPMVQ